MTREELESLMPGELVVVNGREEHIGHDKMTFIKDMECRIGKTFRVKDPAWCGTVRLMDDDGKDIGWYWYPSHLTRVKDIFDPIPETELMNLIYGA